MTHFLEFYVFGCASLFINLFVRSEKYILLHIIIVIHPMLKFKEHHDIGYN